MARVLIIEPDHQLAKTIKKYLVAKGHSVGWRPDPQGAVNNADKHRPHVIILDLSLGSHNGVEFLYEFRSYPEWLTIPIIIYTNLSKQELAGLEDALAELSVATYLYKPTTTVAKLSETVDSLVSAVPA